MKVSRLGVMLVIIAAIIAWAIGDEFAKSSRAHKTEATQLRLELTRLKLLANDNTLESRVASARTASQDIKQAAFSGASLTAARAQLTTELQSLVARSSSNGTIFRLTRASGSSDVPTSRSAFEPSSVTARSLSTRIMAPGFNVEAFSVSGTFTPESFLTLISEFARSPRLLVLDGFSVKGSRFEVLGSAALFVAPPAVGNTANGSK